MGPHRGPAEFTEKRGGFKKQRTGSKLGAKKGRVLCAARKAFSKKNLNIQFVGDCRKGMGWVKKRQPACKTIEITKKGKKGR